MVRPLDLNTLVRLSRRRQRPGAPPPPLRLDLPAGMTEPLGCDAVAVPAALGPRLMSRLPRVGCVYEDGPHWWWIVPADSDVAMEWPSPVAYSAGAVVRSGGRRTPVLINRPEGDVPYTPPIPLYLALCRVTGTTPGWSPVGAGAPPG
ncbi:hypothetical protein [Streptomyces sp. NRRL S-920]|uniref:hypothetical protein n=1 Tax=Streptomyces sp. NRRL S-920 TaxID=1463921 RepID=UPI0004C94513|nr:hypothetical protein [Streptomyces sp. NRRL S-920]